jgi:hypothetical protein
MAVSFSGADGLEWVLVNLNAVFHVHFKGSGGPIAATNTFTWVLYARVPYCESRDSDD